MSGFVKKFPYEACKTCESTAKRSERCKTCEDGSNHAELWDADPNCVHKIVAGNGVRCTKCGGWCCF